MIFNPIKGVIDLDKDEMEVIACAVRVYGGFLRDNEKCALRHGLWNSALRVEVVPAATKMLRLWNIDARYKYADKMTRVLEEMLTHVPEWEENLRKMLKGKCNVSNQQPDGYA